MAKALSDRKSKGDSRQPNATSAADAVYSYLEELGAAMQQSPLGIIVHEEDRWQRDPDGIVRKRQIRTPTVGLVLHTHKEDSTKYLEAAQAIRADAVFGSLIGGQVGTTMGSSIFNEDTVISHACDGMLSDLDADDKCMIQLSRDVVEKNISDLRDYVQAKERDSIAIIPLPGLKSDLFPFKLEDGIEFDALTDDEINACADSGVLRPFNPGWPLLSAAECVGVRMKISLPAKTTTIQELEAQRSKLLAAAQTESLKPHRFGARSPYHLGELVDDILFALRLAKSDFLSTLGIVMTTKSHLGTSRTWISRPTRQFLVTNYELDQATGDEVKRIWNLLKSRGERKHSLPSICERRFNAAVDRLAIEDAVVDYLIAAEALFLRDAGSTQDRGELGFRLSLRTAYFLANNNPNRKDTLKFMRRAYDLRSTVAHGGSLDAKVKVSGRKDEVPLHVFVEELGGLMRQALRQAIALYPADKTFGTVDYWDALIFA